MGVNGTEKILSRLIEKTMFNEKVINNLVMSRRLDNSLIDELACGGGLRNDGDGHEGADFLAPGGLGFESGDFFA